ncbi:MAG: M23 family metallopeptidase [Rhodospirillales bacterium]|nr:M23 family metallopeptidase [Rhodospirillales bacterium]
MSSDPAAEMPGRPGVNSVEWSREILMPDQPSPIRLLQASPKILALSAIAAASLLAGAAVWYKMAAATPAPPPLVDLESELLAAPGAAVASFLVAGLDLAEAPSAVSKEVEVGRGDTLMALLVDAGAERRDAHNAITALSEEFSPRELKPGQAIRLAFAATGATADDAATLRLVSLSLQPGPEREVVVARHPLEGGFEARSIARPLDRALNAGRGTIVSSLFIAGQEANVPGPVMIELIRAFSFDVDFQREIQKDDSFEVLYETFTDINGELAKTGEVLYAALTLSGSRVELYRFTPESGRTDYFGPQGQSVRKTLMRTPIDGARISSGYGKRKHPVLGYTKMHRGTDFAAPRGTPVYAAGDGVIEKAGRNGSYGKYVRIRHNGTYKTAYAHLNGYAKGIRGGQRVKQGQVIAYVGSTGRSTGPHLHYEVHVNGKQANPLRIKLPSGEKLKGGDLEAFQAARIELEQLYAQTLRGTLIAAKPCPAGTVVEEGSTEAVAPPPRGC